jgi:hypothetical protein
MARTVFAGGVLVAEYDVPSAVASTQSAMDSGAATVFEATFTAGPCVAKADILRRQGGGWHVIEVKMSLEDTKSLSDLVDDLAYTATVAKRSGVNVVAASLMLITRAYRKGMAAEKLFSILDQTVEVNARVAEFEAALDETDRLTAGAERPTTNLCGHCPKCDHFETACLGKGVEHPVTTLPQIRANKLIELGQLGVVGIHDLPLSFKLSDNQQRICDCVRSNKPHVSDSLADDLAAVVWPAYYLDFETVMTPLPLYEGTAPFAQITTQYSVHECSAPGVEVDHREYLADPSHDCERELAEKLINDLGEIGSIIVYSPFEKTRIGALGKRFPDLATSLDGLVARLFDLLPVLRKGYYHPEFGGSFSIKKTLPAMVPGMSYNGMEIGDSDTAVARFAKVAMGRCSARQAEAVREDLLRYCKQDTLAMVRLHAALIEVGVPVK